jgi:Protein of unknown function (DUF3089)
MRNWNFIAFILMSLCMTACSSGVYRVTDKFEKVPAPPAPDYTKAFHWAALPDKRDAADSLPNGIDLKDAQTIAKADVFFIHPTIFTDKPTNSYRWNADVNDQPLNKEIQATTILNQATVFNGSCKVYAPYYRQAHLYAFYTADQADAKKALDLAYEDVKVAFEIYLSRFNNGRPIVIASHSQGSYHAERLLKEFFDDKPLKNKLVAAYLIGRAIKPDAFKTILPSEKPDEIGVWSSWNTFAQKHYPKNYERYFKDAQSTNPLLWNSSETFASKELSKGGVGPKFTYFPQLADAQNHAGMLWINKPYIKGRAFIRTKEWHYADINLFYMNIRQNVELRIQRYLEQNGTVEAGK